VGNKKEILTNFRII